MRACLWNGCLIGLAFGVADAGLAAVTGFRVPLPILLAVLLGDAAVAMLVAICVARVLPRTRTDGATHWRTTFLAMSTAIAFEAAVHAGLRREDLLRPIGVTVMLVVAVLALAGWWCARRRAPTMKSEPVAWLLTILAQLAFLATPLAAAWAADRTGIGFARRDLVTALASLVVACVIAPRLPSPRHASALVCSGALVISVLSCSALALACTSERVELPSGERTERSREKQRLNVLLLSIDTLRDDIVGAHVGERSITPNLDQLAHQGVRFPVATTPASWTLPAHASLLTGLYPGAHQVLYDTQRLTTTIPTLAERMRDLGYATIGITGGGYVSSRHGLDRGFECFDDQAGYRFFFVHEPAVIRLLAKSRLRSVLEFLEIHGGFAPVVDRVTRWMAGAPTEPFFLFLHTYEVHNYFHAYPWLDPILARDGEVKASDPLLRAHLAPVFMRRVGVAGFATFAALYRAEVEWIDAQVGRLLEGLRGTGLAERTAVIVVSDHGEGFDLVRDRIYHGGRFHEDLVRVPMIVRLPHASPSEDARPKSLVDVMPTILALAGTPMGGLDGISLLEPGLAGRVVFGEEVYFYDSRHPLGKRPTAANEPRLSYARTEFQKLIRGPGGWQQFDLRRDPGENASLGAVDGDLMRALDAIAKRGSALVPATDAPVTSSSLQQLRQLGYGK